ncbi:hypothetical protein Aeh1ORF144c [Aeromonas phage Aeh1]|uniref:Uncharacterized protein n=1 Tax=Aeromonas phage Aeh1 TaxID=2880362 RepID=Q76YT7_9CAUD|nr:hypothetical protein Aeh1p154 [Aeromonas phage Aeh1]AAQ17809.1 hypothetical protein Aeh1ORF144c [Aeromonas phage Aeh1]
MNLHKLNARYVAESGMTRVKYWDNALNNRMEPFWERVRLETVLKGFYLEYLQSEEDEQCKMGIVEFLKTAKRPFGNKNIPQSIAFNLGWDKNRCLCFDIMGLPEYVENEAKAVYIDLIKEMEKQDEHQSN